MSADNGIYIIGALDASGLKYIYRVAEMPAVENLDFDPDKPESEGWYPNSKLDAVRIMNARMMFVDAPSFDSKDAASVYAHQLEDEIRQSDGILEYGVCCLGEIPFKWEETEKKIPCIVNGCEPDLSYKKGYCFKAPCKYCGEQRIWNA